MFGKKRRQRRDDLIRKLQHDIAELQTTLAHVTVYETLCIEADVSVVLKMTWANDRRRTVGLSPADVLAIGDVAMRGGNVTAFVVLADDFDTD